MTDADLYDPIPRRYEQTGPQRYPSRHVFLDDSQATAYCGTPRLGQPRNYGPGAVDRDVPRGPGRPRTLAATKSGKPVAIQVDDIDVRCRRSMAFDETD